MNGQLCTRVGVGSAAVWLFCAVCAGACIETPAASDMRVRFGAARAPAALGDYAAAPTSDTRTPAPVPMSPTAGSRSVPVAGTGTGGSPARSGSVAPPVAGTQAPVAGSMAAPMPPASAEPAGPADGVLTVKLTSVDQRGRYSPRNCGAVWIETADSKFVKTMERWCGIRAYYLERWTKASGGWGGTRQRPGTTASTPNTADQMDAVSGATLRSHVAHESSWKLRDSKQVLVPDGDYQVVVEMSDGMPHSVVFPFTKGPAASQLKPPDAAPLTGVSIDYQPKAGP